MIITKVVNKIHYWKVFGKVYPEEFVEASEELIDFYDLNIIQVCVADLSDVRSRDISRKIINEFDVFDHKEIIPTIVYGTNNYFYVLYNIVEKFYPRQTKKFVITKNRDDAWKYARNIVSSSKKSKKKI